MFDLENVLMVEGRLDIMRKSRPNINYLETLTCLNHIHEMAWIPRAQIFQPSVITTHVE